MGMGGLMRECAGRWGAAFMDDQKGGDGLKAKRLAGVVGVRSCIMNLKAISNGFSGNHNWEKVGVYLASMVT